MTSLFIPLGVALPAALLLAIVGRRVRPALGMRLLAIAIVSVFVAALASSAMIGIGLVAHHPFGDSFLGWCRDAFPHGVIPFWAPAALVGFTVWSLWRLVAVGRSWFRHRGAGASRVHIVDTAEPLAFAQTGRHGGIVVSTGMLATLDTAEREVLFAHEQAHLDQRHDRYLVIAALGASIPPLIPAAGALRYAVERSADEVAAEAVGDRRLVARALTKVALTSHDRTALTASMAGANVVARIDALAAPRNSRPRSLTFATLALLTLSTILVGAAVQLHHSAEALLRLCIW